ncbi:MAG: hypothetical protein O4861_03525 [Trichodesmium sp. St16_bin4-tuft]|jgi:hypothetical protein|nr:hypothetical protein [Trichodesmium sp. MAG_R01]MDE5071991.1 hypothetical protein [Trichodesmium sp. St5_bin8]MDE5077643.1 hypothetical protein [Trichodesmium sp. St2_bin6]MDE5090633.1 hypothetical protein [Trichodesmium sp. St18_bin3_1_1]MDE5097458.1 hypothetical protein [Trichodesmium sp. St16_bin4-tuft]MDE5105185.1 hypothetical protein [Trichodesmium sp. St19_bin2]
MLWLVIEINIIISIFGFCLAWKIWRFRQILLKVERNLSLIDNYTNNILTKTPEFLQLRQQKVNQIRHLYQQLDGQVQQLQQIIAMFWLLRNLWHRWSRTWHSK